MLCRARDVHRPRELPQRPRVSGKEIRMLKSTILLVAVFTFCALAVVGCKASGQVGDTASSISAPR